MKNLVLTSIILSFFTLLPANANIRDFYNSHKFINLDNSVSDETVFECDEYNPQINMIMVRKKLVLNKIRNKLLALELQKEAVLIDTELTKSQKSKFLLDFNKQSQKLQKKYNKTEKKYNKKINKYKIKIKR